RALAHSRTGSRLRTERDAHTRPNTQSERMRVVDLLPDLDVLREPELTQGGPGRLDPGLDARTTVRDLEPDLQLQARRRDERGEHLGIEVHPLLRRDRP